MKRRLAIYSILLSLVAAVSAAHWVVDRMASLEPQRGMVARATVRADSPHARAQQLLMQYCGSCHDGGRTDFNFNEDSLDVPEMQRNRATWGLALQKLRSGKMPPRDATKPSDEDRDWLANWL